MEESAEQYLDRIGSKIGCWETPGFRDFVLELIEEIDARPKESDLAQMHMAYKAGIEQGQGS